jgi:hypothetical protein
MAEDVQVKNDEQVRQEISALLASGLETEVFPRADTHEEVQEIIARLRQAGDLKEKLVIAGVTAYPVEHGGLDQPCETCMYYLVHRRYCELPELDCPVEPQWSCRLWRI